MTVVRENRLFLGNPGAGKSTLINCLLGGNHMTAGISWGGGLSQDYQCFEKDGIAYMDTPGLADETIQQQAAHAITKALKVSGNYKLFFLVRLQNGRVVSDDLVTLERVLDSIDAGDLNYKFTVIMNCVGARQYKTLTARGDEFKTIKTLINRKYLTESFCFIPRIEALEERSDIVVALPDEVRAFMDSEAPVITVTARHVNPIAVTGFALQSQQIKSELERLRTDQAALLVTMRDQEKRHDEAMKRMRDDHAVEINGLQWGIPMATSPRDHHNYARYPSTPNSGEPSRFSRRKRLVALIIAVVVVIAIVVGVVVGTQSSSPDADKAKLETDLLPQPRTSSPTTTKPTITLAPSDVTTASPPTTTTPRTTTPRTTSPPVVRTPPPPLPTTPTPKTIIWTYFGCFKLGSDLTAVNAVSQPGTTEEDGARFAIQKGREFFVWLTSGTVVAFNAQLNGSPNPPSCQDLKLTLQGGYWNVYRARLA